MADQALMRKVQRQLRERVSDDITVGESSNGVLYLSGRVPGRAERQLAEVLAGELSGGLPVENDLIIERLLPDDRNETRSPDLGEGGLFEGEDEADEAEDLEPDFTSQPLETDDLVAGDSGVDENEPSEDDPDPTYFAPTDPVIGEDAAGNVEVDGGFEPTALDDVSVDRSTEDNIPGDEALADAVREALARDASTESLSLHVTVQSGVVRIYGRVPDLEDAENAESVASDVPGVREVLDETTVENI